MPSEKWIYRTASIAKRNLRLQDKAQENRIKLPLISDDARETSDFIFSPIMPNGRVGDSGSLLLAKKKDNRKNQYLIKHAFCDCAVNEFVYTKLALAMNLKMPEAVLFKLSNGEKRKYFETEYILGTRYLDLKIESPTYAEICAQAINWQDYFRFQALYDIFLEGDSFETPLSSDGYIYRVDASNAFPTSERFLSQAGLNVNIDGQNVKESIKQRMLSYPFENCWDHYNFDKAIEKYETRYGRECAKLYMDPFALVQDIPNDYIDDFLNTLCYFYPDFIGDFFKQFISALQKKAKKVLK